MQMKLFWWLLVENSFLLNFPHTTKFSVKTPGHPHDFWCNKNFIISKTSNNLYKLWRSQDIFIFFTCLSFCPNLWAPHFCLGSWVEGSYLKKKRRNGRFSGQESHFWSIKFFKDLLIIILWHILKWYAKLNNFCKRGFLIRWFFFIYLCQTMYKW